MDKIIIKGARENNLKNIDIEIPKNKLVVMTGVSGSGKSSLAFDTIYAEGQRRYVESLSAYARQFLGGSEKPEVDSIDGLSPSISIDQKTTNKNPRSTVGTVTEIYDYLRLLFARIGVPYCPIHKNPIKSQSIEEMVNKIMDYPEGTKLEIMSPIARGEKGTFKDLFEDLRKDGFSRVRVDGENRDLSEDIVLEKNIKHVINLIVDRMTVNEKSRSRLFEAIELSCKMANGKVLINILGDKEILMSENYACPLCDYSLEELEPRMFSFNSPYGACPECKGLGVKMSIDEDLLVPDKSLSILNGAVTSFQSGETLSIYFKKLDSVCKYYNIDLSKPVKDLTKDEFNTIFYGSKDKIHFNVHTRSGSILKSYDYFEGIITNLERRYMETNSPSIRTWIESYMKENPCPVCKGKRLSEKILNVFIDGKNIYDITNYSIGDLVTYFDNIKLTKEQENISFLILKEMRDLGNTLIVVEHDTDTMLASDYLIDIGPGAGENGGYVVAAGTPLEVMKNKNSLTGKYLTGELGIDVPKKRRKGNGKFIEIKGCEEHNLKKVNVKFPKGTFTCVTGVSGSGKSSLVNEILYKKLASTIYRSKETPGKFKTIKGIEDVDKVVYISQDPIGRTPRSNPATYVGLFDLIRDVFTETKEAKLRGYNKSRFSFNVKGGRCEACQGDGVKKIEMHFLPDVYVPCDVCHGKKYNKETLNIKFKGLSIADVLDLRVDEALEVFENVPKVKRILETMHDVGLGYVKLGQNAVTLSGGEACRVKLAKELQKKPTGKSVFILDEPSTGLHIDDIKKLLVILNRIVDNGDTVVVIEHNLDVIKVADYIIDLGPEGGDLGGQVVCTGTPEKVAKCKESYTGQYLKRELNK